MSLALVLLGCAPLGSAAPHAEGPRVLPGANSKADNYITVGKMEFDLFGEATVRLPDNFYEYREVDKPSVALREANDRYSQVWSAIARHINERLESANNGGWRNLWGVFGPPPGDPKYSMFWRGYFDERIEIIEFSGYTATFRFRLGFLGSPEFQNFLSDSSGNFDVSVPATSLGDSESIEVELVPSDSQDAFPKYRELFEDGVFDLGIHLGDDYNEERFDLERGRWFVNEFLLEEGWVSTTGAQSFDELTLESGPFVKDLILEGEPVQARIHLTHAEMADSDSDLPALRAIVEESFRSRDIVMYAGHAGPQFGLSLDDAPHYSVFPGAMEVRDSYQIFVFQGCETYQTLAANVLESGKTYDTVDIVSTFNTTPFSAGYTVLQGMVELLTLTSDDGDHYPVSWLRILERFNRGPGAGVHYGVHGIEQDPQINPNGSFGVSCTPCESDSDCEGGGNFCLQMNNGGFCGVACTTDDACGAGSSCIEAFEEDYIHLPKQCVPNNLRCG